MRGGNRIWKRGLGLPAGRHSLTSPLVGRSSQGRAVHMTRAVTGQQAGDGFHLRVDLHLYPRLGTHLAATHGTDWLPEPGTPWCGQCHLSHVEKVKLCMRAWSACQVVVTLQSVRGLASSWLSSYVNSSLRRRWGLTQHSPLSLRPTRTMGVGYDVAVPKEQV